MHTCSHWRPRQLVQQTLRRFCSHIITSWHFLPKEEGRAACWTAIAPKTHRFLKSWQKERYSTPSLLRFQLCYNLPVYPDLLFWLSKSPIVITIHGLETQRRYICTASKLLWILFNYLISAFRRLSSQYVSIISWVFR